jgi:hypothetical protein
MSDLQQARDLVTTTLQAALAAAREHAAALAAVAIDETAGWEAAAEAVVPRLDRDLLRKVGATVGEPRLVDLVDSHDAAIAAAQARRDDLRDEILEQPEFEAVGERRKAIEARLLDARARIKELRARTGMLPLIEAARKGARLKDDHVRAVRAYDELQAGVTALEAEASRLAAITARHHRARRDLANADDDIRAITDRFLLDARRVVVAKLMEAGGPRPAHADVARAVLVAEAAAARRTVLTVLYESWVRPHGVALMGFEAEQTQGMMGFEAMSFAQRAMLACRDAGAAVDAYRQRAALVATHSPPSAPVADWWSTLVPDVPRPDDAIFLSLGLTPLTRRQGTSSPSSSGLSASAASASDKLAAAWAAIRGHDGGEAIDDAGAVMEGDLSPGDTEVLLALPRAPALQATNANVSLSSAEYQDIVGDVGGGSDLDVFTAAPASAPSPPVNPFAVKASPPVTVTGELPRPTFSPGSRVGRCLVSGLIGKGGMGEVYRARLEGELGFSRQVVLKRLAVEHVEDESLLASFVREAEVAARIAHPNVVQIFDLQRHGAEPFIIMEYLEGLSLQKLASRAWRAGMGLDADVLTRCALDAARGLHAAHTMRGDDGTLVGLVHRDVSPDNLFLCTSGFTKLLDFGIARRSDLKTMTGKNELKGKIPYMSPEQILGEPLDARSDLFSLGSSLYYLLTGKRPFVGDNDVTTLYAVVNKAHRPLNEVRPDAAGLVEVVEALLQKQPDDRPASALEVVERLARAEAASAEEAAAFLRQIEEL